MPAHAKHAHVERDARVTKSREAKPAIGSGKNRETREDRRDFQPPGEAIVRLPARPGGRRQHDHEKRQVRSRDLFHAAPDSSFLRASSTARLMAAIILSGRAIFLPAISKAVPWSGLVRGKGSPSVTFTPSWKAWSFSGIKA